MVIVKLSPGDIPVSSVDARLVLWLTQTGYAYFVLR